MNTPIDQKKIIGENIKAARKIKGLSQRSLAEKLGIAFQNLSVWENGKGAPSAKYLMKLSEILGISLDQLTSPSGFISVTEGVAPGRRPYRAYPPGAFPEQIESELQKSLLSEIPKIVQRELSDNHSLKLIIAYLEEVLSVLRPSAQVQFDIRRAADSQFYRTYTQDVPRIPLPPVNLAKEDRANWERNATTLLKWSQSDLAFWVPAWAMEKYCRTVDPTSFGENLPEITKVLKGYLEEGKGV
jgi:transcriptional regulator with XRE-family HTH domain